MSQPNLTAILVHYHTPELVRPAVLSVLREAAACGLSLELLLVDNGSTAPGRVGWEGLGLTVLAPEENLGYAAAVNLAAAASRAPLLLVLNPDVELLPGCLAALLAELHEGAAAAGPLFFLDRGRRLRLPPTEERRPGPELAARLARRRESWAERARRRWRRHARRHWCAARPMATRSLSGALVAFPRRVWEQVPLDGGYRLYFEEDDWLARLQERGLEARFVPAARALHLYNRSAAGEPRAARWFAESAERFARRWYGEGFARLLAGLEPRRRRPWPPVPFLPPGRPALPARPELQGPVWVELALAAEGYPAAAEVLEQGLDAPWELPLEVWEGLPEGTGLLQVVSEEGRELARFRFAREAGS